MFARPLLRAALSCALLTHCTSSPRTPSAWAVPDAGVHTSTDAAARRPVDSDAARQRTDAGPAVASPPVDASREPRDGGQLQPGPTLGDATMEPVAAHEGDAAGPALPPRALSPAPPQNPWAAGRGLSSQHGDTGASDTSPLAGPGAGPLVSAHLDLLAACPSIFPLESGLLLAVCTQITDQVPLVYLVDPRALTTLATRALVQGGLFGGVYPYLDQQERLVVVDGANDLLRIAATRSASGSWSLSVQETRALGPALREHCGATDCDGVVGLAPDYQGRVWFATARGLIGTVGLEGAVQTAALPSGESVANSIATAPAGTAVVTDRALYLLRANVDGRPMVLLRASYERGPARKPGQLSWGSGSTPTFFGPRTGSEYLAISDNARPTNLIVLRTDGSATPVCKLQIAGSAGDGTENSPIGYDRSVFVTSTFGYPYPALPADAGESVPPSAPLRGGMARVDIADDESGCTQTWSIDVRSAAVPKLSTHDGMIYTVERKPLLSSGLASPIDRYAHVVIDAASGAVLTRRELLGIPDTMQLAGTLAPDQTLYQGTIAGILRLTPATAR
jgi:hypothetical protein